MSGTVIFLSGGIFSPYCLKKVERRQESLKDRTGDDSDPVLFIYLTPYGSPAQPIELK